MPGIRRSTAVPVEFSCAVPRTAEFTQCAAVASQNVTKPGDTVVLTPVVTVAVSVTRVPFVTGLAGGDRVVVVVTAPKAKLAGAATVAKRRASTAKKTPEKERELDVGFSKQFLEVVQCDDMLISVTTNGVTRSFQADGCALRRSSGGWWPLSTAALFFC
jgi:hypothetical protein